MRQDCDFMHPYFILLSHNSAIGIVLYIQQNIFTKDATQPHRSLHLLCRIVVSTKHFPIAAKAERDLPYSVC